MRFDVLGAVCGVVLLGASPARAAAPLSFVPGQGPPPVRLDSRRGPALTSGDLIAPDVTAQLVVTREHTSPLCDG